MDTRDSMIFTGDITQCCLQLNAFMNAYRDIILASSQHTCFWRMYEKTFIEVLLDIATGTQSAPQHQYTYIGTRFSSFFGKFSKIGSNTMLKNVNNDHC